MMKISISERQQELIVEFKEDRCGWCTHSGRFDYSAVRDISCFFPFRSKSYIIPMELSFRRITPKHIALCKLSGWYEHIDMWQR